MIFPIHELDGCQLQEMAAHYAEHGYCVISGVDAIREELCEVVAETIGITRQEMEPLLDAAHPAAVFPPDIRERLARVTTSPHLAQSLVRALRPVLKRFLGPFVHVSSNFHAQFKGVSSTPVDHGGYLGGLQHLEVHGPYLLHQDFAGASIPTSPSAVTLWVGLNSCPDWNLRVFPGSHKLGLLCNRWLNLDDERLVNLQPPVDIAAQPGRAVLFNALMLHGTSNAGPLRRVSCDIRFFPLCGFLPSHVHLLSDTPVVALRSALEHTQDEVLLAPLLEAKAFVGGNIGIADVPAFSALNWAKFVSHVVAGETERAIPWLERFVNTDIGADEASAYIPKFTAWPAQNSTLRAVHARLRELEAEAPEVAQLGAVLDVAQKLAAQAAAVGGAS